MRAFWVAGLLAAAVAAALVFQLPVETRQGVDFVVQRKQIPLILKVADFYTRHLQYKTLVDEIVSGVEGDEERVLVLFRWVHQHIHPGTPEDLHVIDDHPWNIIVRGYGESDQLSDVFVTLCSYVGVPAYFHVVRAPSTGAGLAFSMVSLDGKWRLFDPYFGIVFRNRAGELATPEEARTDALLQAIESPPVYRGTPYAELVRSEDVVMISDRGRYQTPWMRLTYALGW